MPFVSLNKTNTISGRSKKGGFIPLKNIEDAQPPPPPEKIAASERLPETLQFGPWDTGVGIPKKVSAALAGVGYGITDTYKGIKQILNIDTESMKEDARLMRELRADPDVGTYATVGEVAGVLADPVGLAIPAAKGKSLAGMAKIGAVTGAATGALGYVDEEADESRLKKTALGAAGGAIVLPAIGAGTNVVRKIRGKELIPLVSRKSSGLAEKTGLIPTPDGLVAEVPTVKKTISKAIKKTIKEESTKEGGFIPLEDIEKAVRTPGFKRTAEDKLILRSVPKKKISAFKKAGFLRTAEDKIIIKNPVPETILYSNPFEPELIKKSLKNVGDVYQTYAGKPLKEAVFKSPGASLTGAAGAATGYQTAEEDAPVTEKLGRAALGFVIGFGGAKGISKIPVKEGKNMGDILSRGFIDNSGLSPKYIGMKKKLGTYKNHIASQFMDIAKEAAELSPSQRKLLYNILEGEAPATRDLLALTERARRKITETGQLMVDYGLLTPEVFKKNAASYIHRSYTSKLGAGPGFASKKIKMIGDELKPRGVFRDVSEKQVKKWTDLGWEAFGSPRGGKQKIRWQLTKDQRKALGEIEDSAFAIAETGRLMSNDVATFKFYDDIATSEFASNNAVEGWLRVSSDDIAKTKIKKYGNLAGKYVPEEIYNDLNWINKAKDIKNIPGIKQYRQLNAWWKVSKTALNPVVHTNNIMSNILLYDFADADYKYLKTAANEMLNASRGKSSKYFKMATESGVFEADFAVNELRTMNKGWLETYSKTIGIEDNPVGSAVNISKKVWSKTGGKLIDLYQKEDHLYRLGVFIDRLNKGASVEKAALEARKWFIDYDINAPVINFMRETTTPFIAYSYRIIPLLAETATMRPWKFAKWAVLGWAVNAVGEKYGGGDTEKERKLFPERQKGKLFGMPGVPQMIKMPFQAKGASQYLDVTRFTPGGDIFDITEDGEIIPFLPAPAQPSFGALGSIMQAGYGYDTFTKKKLKGLGISKTEDAKIKAKYLQKQFTPNFPGIPGAYSTEKILKSVRGQETVLGNRLPVWQAVLQSIGIKLRPADLKKMSMRAMFETNKKIDAIKEKIREARYDLKAGKISENQYNEQKENWQKEANAWMKKLQKKLK